MWKWICSFFDRSDRYYVAYIICENCRFEGKGELVKGISIQNNNCPYCGCTYLKYKKKTDNI